MPRAKALAAIRFKCLTFIVDLQKIGGNNPRER
jgi:hypothetical protein